MSKYVLVPDSFKGTMTSREICEIMQHAIERIDSDAKSYPFPLRTAEKAAWMRFFPRSAASERRLP